GAAKWRLRRRGARCDVTLLRRRRRHLAAPGEARSSGQAIVQICLTDPDTLAFLGHNMCERRMLSFNSKGGQYGNLASWNLSTVSIRRPYGDKSSHPAGRTGRSKCFACLLHDGNPSSPK